MNIFAIDDLTYMLITLRMPATRAPAIDLYGMLYKEITAFEHSKTASERPAPQRCTVFSRGKLMKVAGRAGS
jgi:hypothetical protein